MGNIDWEHRLKETLDSIPYVKNAHVKKEHLEFIFMPDGKNEQEHRINKDKMDKLISTLEERLRINKPMDIIIKSEKISEDKIKYTIKVVPYKFLPESQKEALLANSSGELCNIIDNYLYKVDNIKVQYGHQKKSV